VLFFVLIQRKKAARQISYLIPRVTAKTKSSEHGRNNYSIEKSKEFSFPSASCLPPPAFSVLHHHHLLYA